ncbi:MAG: hypothetical protein M1813_009326 [Trichoglossum hirsutum]|nr:MAG: hypothetical protein M1813_009326 [Trichoglossum hirsutum]
MVEPIGTTLAAVSLTFQVFSGCMAGYQLISDANNMPKQYEYLMVRLKTEQHRLLDWARVAGISETDETLSKSVARLNRQLLLDILHQKESLLLSFGKLDARYQKVLKKPLLMDEPPPAYSEKQQLTRRGAFQDRFPGLHDALMERALTFVEQTRRYPTKLRWATFDNKKFENLLFKLNEFNNFMKELLDTQQQHVLRQAHQETQLQIVQLNDKVDYLVQIFQSAAAVGHKLRASQGPKIDPIQQFMQTLDTDDEPSPPYEDDHNLAKLARFKGLNTAIDRDQLDAKIASNLNLGEVLVNPELDPNLFKPVNPGGKLIHNREEAVYDGQRVWVEWKRYDPDPRSDKEEPPAYIAKRVRQLAILLHDEQKPEEFRAPRCLGYFDDPSEVDTRFGLVFSTPPSTPDSSSPVPLTHLFQTLKPSLTTRIALARAITDCIRYLHSTNWLHKGLRSHNIIFFASSSKDSSEDPSEDPSTTTTTTTTTYDLTNPILAGFDYARPARSEEMTERPPENPEYDIYRHPFTHGDGPLESYKKPFDIYSLGVILVEIANWLPIDRIVGITDLPKAKPDRTRAVQRILLDGDNDYLRSVAFAVGESYRDAVVMCLTGEFGLGLKALKEYKEEVHGARLQTGFYEKVVLKLGKIATGE